MLSIFFRKQCLLVLPFLLVLVGCGAKDSPDHYRLPESLEGPNWFVIDKTGRKVFDVPHNYKIGEYHEGLCRFAKVENGELVMGFLDPEGKIAIQPRYSYCSDFSEGRAYVSLRDSWQLFAPVQVIDHQGKIVAAAPGKVLTQMRNSSLAIVEPLSVEPMIPWYFRSGQCRRINCGLIDHNGKEVVPCQFESASEFGHDMALGEGRSSTTVFDRSGHRLFEAEYSLSGGYHEGLAAARKILGSNSEPGELQAGGSFIYGYVDKTGEVKIPFRYCYAEAFSEGLAVVADDKGVLFIDREGRDAFGKRFEGCRSFRSGVAAVKTNGLYGFIDKSGRFVIEPQYSQAESFDGGAAVCAIATNKNLSSSPRDSFRDFLDSRFVVRPLKLPTFFEPIKLSSCFYRRLKYGLVNSSGQWLVKPIYDSMFSLRDGMRIVEMDGKYGFIDANGREIIKPVFPGVSNFNDGRAIASVDPTARVWDRQSSDPVNIVSDSLDFFSGVDPGIIEDSIKVLSKVVDMAPESANAYANRGRFYYQAGCYEGALSDFQKALERKPECKNFLYWRGCSYLKLKRWRAAEKDFLPLDPSLLAVSPTTRLGNWPFNLDRQFEFDPFPRASESQLVLARAGQG